MNIITINEREFELLSGYVNRNFGIKLPKEKIALVQGRLQTVLAEKGFKTFSEFYKHLVSDCTGNAARLLIDRITTNHTFFMRETEHFKSFAQTVLPFLKANCREKDVRIWSAGCSTGEEPYTLAMIIDEYFGGEKYFWDTTILATDISSKAIEKAVSGIYSEDEISGIPVIWKNKYFKRIGDDKHIVVDKIRNGVIYRRFNLNEKDFPFKKKFHVIFCRNVMIYFDKEAKNQLACKFYNCLQEGGYLFIGLSETLANTGTKFKYIAPSVYRKG